MKNRIKQILFVAVSAVMAASCSLEEDTSSLYTPENYFASKAECQSAVNSCYIPLKTIYNATYFLATECCSDLMYCPSGTLDASPRFLRLFRVMARLCGHRVISVCRDVTSPSPESRPASLCLMRTRWIFFVK